MKIKKGTSTGRGRKKSTTGSGKTPDRVETENNQFPREILSKAVVERTGGNPFTIVKTVDSFLFIMEFIRDIMDEQMQGYLDDEGNLVLKAEEAFGPGVNYVGYINLIYPNAIYSGPLVGGVNIEDRVKEKVTDRTFYSAFSLLSSMVYLKRDPAVTQAPTEGWELIKELNAAGPRNTMRNNPSNILDHICCFRFLEETYSRMPVSDMVARVGQKLGIEDGSDENSQFYQRVATKILNTKTMVNLFIGFLPESVQWLQNNIDRYIMISNIRSMDTGEFVKQEHSRRIDQLGMNGMQVNHSTLVCDRNFNLFIDTENRAIDGSLQSKMNIHTHKTNKESVKKLLECVRSKDVSDVHDELFTGGINASQSTLFSFYNQHVLSDMNMDEILNSYNKGISARSRALTYIDRVVTVDDLGGMDRFKEKVMLYKKRHENKGGKRRGNSILMTGVQGAGKTMAAHWSSAFLERDLYRFNVSALMASLIGATESNTDRELQIIRELGSIVLWIDEIEKVFGGVQSSHATDGGVLLRVMEKVMQFLEEENPEVFVVMTANSLDKLPAELLRSGRVSHIMFVDFPTEDELIEIIKIQNRLELEKQLDLTDRDIKTLSGMMMSRCPYNGIDVRELFRYVSDRCIIEDRDPQFEDLIHAFVEVQPNYEKHGEKIEKTREEGLSRFEPASSNSEAYEKYLKATTDSVKAMAQKVKDPRIRKILTDRKVGNGNSPVRPPAEVMG